MRIVLSAETIAARVAALGAEITRDYTGRNLVVVCTLKGGFVFAADLIRAIDTPMYVEFLRGESYSEGSASAGVVRITQEPDMLLAGRDVLLIEDIIDTGQSAFQLLEVLRAHKPATLRTCALLHKPAHQVVTIPINYLGFTINEEFVVGYGLDKGGLWRNVPYVGVVDSEE
jgi:hypoxanthine phosphoribosyltransferase